MQPAERQLTQVVVQSGHLVVGPADFIIIIIIKISGNDSVCGGAVLCEVKCASAESSHSHVLRHHHLHTAG